MRSPESDLQAAVRSRTRRSPFLVVAACLLATSIGAMFSATSSAATGDLVGTANFSQQCGGFQGVGVGVTFDGSNLWYSCAESTPDLFRADPHTGQVTASYTIGGGIGALAYDATNNVIYAGWGNSSNQGNIYSIQLDANRNVTSSAVKFTAPGAIVCGLDDGLAYDGSNDTLYVSDDCSTTIHHYDTSGNELGSFSWAGSGCYNSGLALGNQLIFEGADGCSTVYVVDKDANQTVKYQFSTAVAGDPNFRDEGLSCDTSSFPGMDVMWSKEAYAPERAHAFEIPASSCGVGGLGAGGVGAPQSLRVTPENGSAEVSWLPPNTGANLVSGYIITATPTYTDRVPSPNAGSFSTVVNSPTLSWKIPGLLEDCHQRYSISVSAENGVNVGPPAISDSFRPSGIVMPGATPPYVVVLLDGINESKPQETFDPYRPTLDGVPSYCPESWDGSSSTEAEADFAGTPKGPWEFFNKWNFADPGTDAATGSNSTPRDLSGSATHAFMLDAIAAQGTVILPYSYTQALLTRSLGSDPTFSFKAYGVCDSTPPGSPLGQGCSRKSINDDVVTLEKELASIHSVWRTSDIILMGHSQGGLIAFEWWLRFGAEAARGSAAAAVGDIFTLDSPVNGVCYTPFCLGPTGYPKYNPDKQRYARDRRHLEQDANAGDPVHLLGTSGDTVPIFAGGAYGPAGKENLQHELMVTGPQCGDQGNNTDCPAPPDHVSGCPIDPKTSPSWVNDDQHFIVKFCPDDVAYVNNALGLSY